MPTAGGNAILCSNHGLVVKGNNVPNNKVFVSSSELSSRTISRGIKWRVEDTTD
jgi:hypothetical protein